MLTRHRVFFFAALVLCAVVGCRREAHEPSVSSETTEKKKPTFSAADRIPGPSHLIDLVRNSDTIVVGTPTRLIRDTPLDPAEPNEGWNSNSVYYVEVEETLKGGDLQAVKVLINGSANTRSMVMCGGLPLLTLGKRYLLSLRHFDDPYSKELGYVASEWGGKQYRVAELDELHLSAHSDSTLLLEEGIVKMNYDEYQKAEGTDLDEDEAEKVFGNREDLVRQLFREAVHKTKDEKPYWEG